MKVEAKSFTINEVSEYLNKGNFDLKGKDRCFQNEI